MPLQRPDIEQVKNLAGKFGIDLTDTEARLFRIRILEHIEAMEQFQELRIEEDQPPFLYFDRDVGYRATEAEDPLNVGLLRFLDFGDDVNIGEWPLYIHDSLKEIQTHRNRLMALPNDYRKVELQHAQKIVSLNIERCKQFFESLKLK